MRIIILLCMLLCVANLQVSSQNPDSTVFSNAVNNFSKKYNKKIDSLRCLQYLQWGKGKVNKDSVYIPSTLYAFSETAKKILSTEYALYEIEGDFVLGEVMPKEMVCFDEYMDSSIKKKKGEGFLGLIIQQGDSLDRIDKGYSEVKLINTELYKDFAKIDSVKTDENFMLALDMHFNKSGKIVNAKFFKGDIRTEQLTELPEGSLKNELNRITNLMRWEPALLKGNSINDRKVILINKNLLN